MHVLVAGPFAWGPAASNMFSVVFLLLVLLYYSDGGIQTSESAMVTRQVKSLTCNSAVNLSRMPGRYVVYHAWNQAYYAQCNCSTINLPSIESFNTHYTVELYKFDNNTNIYSMVSVYNASNGLQHVFNLAVDCSGVQRKWISLVDDGYYRYQVDHIFTYDGSKSAQFSCLQYSHLSNLLGIQVGWITTAGDRIFTYNTSEIILNLSDVYNGSMFCCLYYTTSDFNNGKHIQRFVKDITLLIYQKETPNSKGQPTSTTTESYRETQKSIRYSYITTSSATARFITDTSNATGKRLRTTNKTGKPTRTTTQTGKYSGTTTEPSKYSGTTTESSKYSGTTTEPSKYSDTTTESSKYSGTTNKTKQNTNTTGKTTGTANETSKYSGTANETSKYSDIANETSKYSGTTNRTDSSNYDAETTDYITIIISSITAIMVLLLVGICAVRRHCWKKTNRPERAQLPLPQIPGTRLRPANEPDPNTPFYLNLLFRRECELEIQAREEPHYEEVMYQ